LFKEYEIYPLARNKCIANVIIYKDQIIFPSLWPNLGFKSTSQKVSITRVNRFIPILKPHIHVHKCRKICRDWRILIIIKKKKKKIYLYP